MLTELTAKEKVVGMKQTRRALAAGGVQCVFLACDADPHLTAPLENMCALAHVPVESGHTMAELGSACGIAVGTAVCAILA